MNWATTRFLASLRRPLWTAPIAELPSLKDGATAWFSVSQVWDRYCYLLGHSLLYTQRQCHWLCPRMTVWAQLRLNSDKMNRSIADGEIKAYAGHSSLSVWASCLPLHQTNGESGSLLTFISNAYQSHQAFPDDLLPPPHCYHCYILPPPPPSFCSQEIGKSVTNSSLSSLPPKR